MGLLFLMKPCPAMAQKPKTVARKTEDVRRPKRQKLDKKFWALWVPAIALMVANVEYTASCVRNHTCQGFLLYGNRPTRLRLYAINGGYAALNFYVSQAWKRDPDGVTWGWQYPPLFVAAANGIPLVVQLAQGGPTRAAQAAQRRVANVPASEVVVISPTQRLSPGVPGPSK